MLSLLPGSIENLKEEILGDTAVPPLVDNATIVPHGEPRYDCLARVRPVIAAIKDTFLSICHPHRDNTIDEAMIKIKGLSALKQFVPLKPTKRGFKVWVRADSVIGYISVYTGKEGAPEKYLGEKVVKKLTRPVVGGNYHMYCDNYFTKVALFQDLLDDDICACGAFRRDRHGIPEALKKLGNCCLQIRQSYSYVNTRTQSNHRCTSLHNAKQ